MISAIVEGNRTRKNYSRSIFEKQVTVIVVANRYDAELQDIKDKI